MTITINVYRMAGNWYGARWIDGEYDGCDELDGAGEDEAIEEARSMPLDASGDRVVTRVDAPAA